MENWVLYIIAGIVTGILSALFGVGGGLVLVPILTLLFGFGQKSAQGMSLVIILPTALIGAIRYKLHPEIPLNLTVCGLMALGGIAGAMLGSHLAFSMSAVLLKRLFAALLIYVGISMLVNSFSKPNKVPIQDLATEKLLNEEVE